MARAKKQALGRGLSALLKESDSVIYKNANAIVGSTIELEMALIEANPFQPRSHFDEENLLGLSESIKELGVVQPITVRKSNNKFQLISGERRFRASKLIGKKTIPAYVRIANDQEMLEMALVENIQRENLDPIEVSLSYKRLIDEIKLTQEELSARVGKKRSTITNYLRLLKLDPIIQTGIRDGFLSMGHGRSLINVVNLEDQMDIYKKIIKNELSVRQTEDLVKKIKDSKSPKKENSKSKIPKFVKEGVALISNYFGNKVQITTDSKGKGKISIPFYSEEDFNRIKKLLE